MTTYIVKDKEGREVWRGEEQDEREALAWGYSAIRDEIEDLMLAAGYTVEEAVEMIKVPIEDLRMALDGSGNLAAADRLRALVEKHRSGK